MKINNYEYETTANRISRAVKIGDRIKVRDRDNNVKTGYYAGQRDMTISFVSELLFIARKKEFATKENLEGLSLGITPFDISRIQEITKIN